MHYDFLRKEFDDRIKTVVEDIKDWNVGDSSYAKEIETLEPYVTPFEHCDKPDSDFLIAGSDGSGDFPSVRYGDSFVYVVISRARLYEAMQPPVRLKELEAKGCDLANLLWMPEDPRKSAEKMDEFFEELIGIPLKEICEHSDYFHYKKLFGRAPATAEGLIGTLIHPEAHEDNNVRIQIMGTAEAAALIRMLKVLDEVCKGRKAYIIQDTTLALPLVKKSVSLFFEIAKRYACAKASEQGVTYLALSKSHNFPRMDLIEEMVAKKVPSRAHWFMRVPSKAMGEKCPNFIGEREIPPVGAVSYLFALHKTTQPMRLDIDINHWKKTIWDEDPEKTKANEIQLFRDLDFAAHDQRCYGYPYPVKASHDLASLTEAERVSIRKQIIDRAIEAGLKRKNFVDPSVTTGHK